jgi:hypothetical protein
MNTNDGVDGTSRLATAISALNQLLDSYDNFGEVRVRLVAFSDVSSSRGSGWMAVSEAKALLAALTPAAAPTTMRRWPRPNPPSPPRQARIRAEHRLLPLGRSAQLHAVGRRCKRGKRLEELPEHQWITSYALGMGSATVRAI